MAKEDKFADEVMSDDELNVVVGGNTYDGEFLNTMVKTLEWNGLSKYLVYGNSSVDTIINTCKKYGIEVEDYTVYGYGSDSERHISFYLDGKWCPLRDIRRGDADVDWLACFSKAITGK